MTEQTPRYEPTGRLGKNLVTSIGVLVLLVYALACLVLMTASDLRDFDRSVLIVFVVLFPVLILVLFVRPITRRAGAPPEPAEAMDESTFLGVMSLLLNAQLERDGNERSVVQAEETAAAAFSAQRRLASHPGARRRILWVDANPEADVLERQAFERVGVRVDGSPDLTTALGRLPYEDYGAVVVTEAADGDGARESYASVGGVKPGGDDAMPLFVYLGSDREDQRLDAINRGAHDATSRPNALFDMVMRSLV
jgi:hypothetical protein